MPGRILVWAVGLVLTAIAIIPLCLDESSRDFIGPVFVLASALIALVAEWIAARSARKNARTTTILERARSADGRVEWVAMAEVESETNSVDPRIGRFVRRGGPDPGPEPPLSRLASSPRLLGRVALVSIFFDTDGRGWTDREIAQGHRSLERSGVWIEREAILRGAPVNVVIPTVYFRAEESADGPVQVEFRPEGDSYGPMEAEAMEKYLAIASRAAARAGFSDMADLVGRINPKVDADAHAWFLHLRGAGRSMAIVATESALFGVGLAVCFSREANFPEPNPGGGRVDPLTIVHELLHLFGATDKYGLDLGAFPPGTVGGDDVMRMDHDSLSRSRIDDLTAAEIGWDEFGRRGGRKKPAEDQKGPRRVVGDPEDG